jgi:hypothetical protein
MFESRMLGRIFGIRKEEVAGAEECIMRSFIVYNLLQILLG